MALGDGNGLDPMALVQELRAEVREVASHVPRIGALETDVILQAAALSRIEILVREGNTNVNNLRHEIQFREDKRLKLEGDRWARLEALLASIATKVGAP